MAWCSHRHPKHAGNANHANLLKCFVLSAFQRVVSTTTSAIDCHAISSLLFSNAEHHGDTAASCARKLLAVRHRHNWESCCFGNESPCWWSHFVVVKVQPRERCVGVVIQKGHTPLWSDFTGHGRLRRGWFDAGLVTRNGSDSIHSHLS